MTISIESAGVIATIVPIGLLIVGFEIRAVPPLVATSRMGTVALWLLGAYLLSGLIFGFVAEYLLVRAVLLGEVVDPASSAVVQFGLVQLAATSFLLLFASLGSVLGLTDRIGRRARERTVQSPRRLARQIEYVEKHHPSVARDRDT